MLAVKPVVRYCAECEERQDCFGQGGRHEHVSIARAQGVVAPKDDHVHGINWVDISHGSQDDALRRRLRTRWVWNSKT